MEYCGSLRRIIKFSSSSFSELFPRSLRSFLHPELLDAHYTNSYFIQHDDKDSARVAGIMLQLMENNLPVALRYVPAVTNATSIVSADQLKSLWKCFADDKVFNQHIPTVLKHWALLLTRDNRLFSASSPILPVCYMYSADIFITGVSEVSQEIKHAFSEYKYRYCRNRLSQIH